MREALGRHDGVASARRRESTFVILVGLGPFTLIRPVVVAAATAAAVLGSSDRLVWSVALVAAAHDRPQVTSAGAGRPCVAWAGGQVRISRMTWRALAEMIGLVFR